jgi:Alkaline phosphatase PhoX
MHGRRKRFGLALLGAVGIATLVVSGGVADPTVGFTNVPSANHKSAGIDPANLLSPELQEVAWASGSIPVENHPAGCDGVKAYGYDVDNNAPFVPTVAATGVGGSLVLNNPTHPEAQKTEPDKNTYLVLNGQTGADGNYNYGTHFLYQGHEAGSPGYISRVNLDADGEHRVTLIACQDVDSKALPTFDGSTWDPWADRLLFTSEAGPNASGDSQGGVWQSTLGGQVVNLQRYLGRGGFEGIQNDDEGNLYIVEDVGGSSFSGTTSRKPNSFVYRFLPKDAADLTNGGTIQVLQILDKNGNPITQSVADSTQNPQPYIDLHTYGTVLDTKWIDIASTSSATAAPGPDDAKLAKSAGGTPLKRPENGLFQPGSHFTEFYFDETGDTNATTGAAQTGGFGSIFRLTQSPTGNAGKIRLFYLGDADHAGFDNNAFFGGTQVAFVEDRGDTLHGQTAFDSAWLFDTTVDYGNASNHPIRFIAEGRDASATLDSSISGVYGSLFSPSKSFYNDGDNEITGIHVSNGDPSKNGILGEKLPTPFRGDGQWRAFWTQQHGDNVTYELISAG